MAVLMTLLASPVTAAAVTAAALLWQGGQQRRSARKQRRDDQAHELRMAQERHTADLERLDREALHRRREANQERLQQAHRTLLRQLDEICSVAPKHKLSAPIRSGSLVDLSDLGVALGDLTSKTEEPEKDMRILASKAASDAGSMALSVAHALVMTCLASSIEPGIPPAQYIKIADDLASARNDYREAPRLDIGAA